MENRRNFNILIVDDSVEQRSLLRTILSCLGVDLIEAASGREAWDIISTVRPDLIISDFEMSNGDGLWLLELLRKEYEIPFILLSGSLKLDSQTVLGKGATAFLTKPYSAQGLLELIQSFVFTDSIQR